VVYYGPALIPCRKETAIDPRPSDGASFVLPASIRAAVFDMDGLLVDTEPLWIAAETELLARRGAVFTEADVAATHGRSILATLEVYAARLGNAEPEALERELLDLMREAYAAGPPLRPGARELVDALRGRLPLAIASNTGEALVRLALQRTGLLEAFTVIVSGFDLGRSKPDPMVYRVACEALRVTPAEAVAFEDSPAGVASARAAGLFVVGVPDRPGVDLRAAGADRVVGSLADVVVRS